MHGRHQTALPEVVISGSYRQGSLHIHRTSRVLPSQQPTADSSTLALTWESLLTDFESSRSLTRPMELVVQ